MFLDSVVTSFDWHQTGKAQGVSPSECLFWTGRDGQLCVQYFRPSSEVTYQPHIHSEYTLVVCLAGKVMIRQAGEEVIIHPGEALISNYGVEHASAYRAWQGWPCEAVSVAFDPALMHQLAGDLNLPLMTPESGPHFAGKVATPALRDCAGGIAAELRGKAVGHKLIIETQAIRLLVEAIRSWPVAAIHPAPRQEVPRLSRREFVRAYEFMRACRKEDFRLQHLCRFLGTSQERFTRLFLATTGQTPASFYNRLLLDRARDLLRNPKLSIKEIGYDLGFKTSSHFTASFRREFQISPLEFRQLLGWGEEALKVV